ncbi:ATP-binding cassette domain-containing protein [Pediococcus ethanolidurans]|uniref:ABC transporter ATP-binding protein n=1 Tax=Pediococcus ethanolidurans TaxID=319653 RepID=UPI002952D6FB|nr:ATP-binding cassette domain-containing protein [Pediococcus ethanolidurans]MDV7720284.1 ATP-binding cassette domain-containing protein [Pediococcus ethanolidurans]
MSYINLKNVSRTIKHKRILQNINLNIEKGTITGFVGPNGSGKTMLFRAILGMIKLDSGEIEINGEKISLGSSPQVNIGTILGTPGFINNYTALDNLKYLAAIKNEIQEKQTLEAMQLFDMIDHKDEKVKSFSLGMRQKLAIIQAIMEDQELIVLDEPTNGLDEASVQTFEDKLRELKNEDKTILIASHDRFVIQSVADQVYQVNEGKVSV